LRVLHVPFTYAPDPIGGTEVYVSNLIASLRACGVDGVVAAPGQKSQAYAAGGIPIHRYATSHGLRLEEMYGEGDAAAAREFGAILDEVHPDLVHVHAFTSASSLLLLREPRLRRLPVVFTYHTPTVTCGRGSLLEFGESVCDGVMEPLRCTRCTLHGKGMQRVAAAAVAMLPESIGRRAVAAGFPGSICTALRMRELQSIRQKTVRAFLSECDRVVAPSRWVRNVLIINGVAAEKLVFCRQGTDAPSRASRRQSNRSDGSLRVAWLGRLIPAKGLHVLVEALAMVRDKRIALDAYAIVEQNADDPYAAGLRARILADGRIRLLPALDPTRVIDALAGYDALAVPSQGLETGPLVVLEAFAAGIPVVGSALGGIAELVEDGKTGVLVDFPDPRAWSDALGRLAGDRAVLESLAANIAAPRTMEHVAAEMQIVYRELLLRRDP